MAGTFLDRRTDVAVPKWGVHIDLDTDALQRHLEAYARVFGMSIQEVIKKQARLFCSDMLDYTMPYMPDPPQMGARAGRTQAAWNAGLGRLEADINRVFAPLSSANWKDIATQDDFSVFVAWYHDRKAEGAELPDWLVNRGTIGVGEWTMFQQRYNQPQYYGYWTGLKKKKKKKAFAIDWSLSHGGASSLEQKHKQIRGGGEDYRDKMYKHTGVFLVGGGQAKIDAYVKRVSLRIGRLKSVFYHMGEMLEPGKIKAPKWISKHPFSGGDGRLTNLLSDPQKPSLTVESLIHSMMSKDPGNTMWRTGLNHRAYAMRDAMARRINAQRSETVYEATERLRLGKFFDFQAGDAPF